MPHLNWQISYVLLANGKFKRAKYVCCGDTLRTYKLDKDLNIYESQSCVKMVLNMHHNKDSDRYYMVHFENKSWITPKLIIHSFLDNKSPFPFIKIESKINVL